MSYRNQNRPIYRRRDVKAHGRSLTFSSLLFVLAIFMGWLSYGTAGKFPFNAGTTTLLGILSFVSLLLAFVLINGIVSIEDDPDARYY